MKHRHRRLTVLATALLVTTALLAGVGSVTADDDGDAPLIDTEGVTDTLTTWSDAVRGVWSGMTDRVAYESAQLNLWGDAPDLETEANDTVSAVNDHDADNGTLEALNTHLDAPYSEGVEVHSITLENDRHNVTETVFIELEYDNGEYTAVEAGNDTDRPISEHHRLSGFLAESAGEETEAFLAETSSDADEFPSDTYASRMGTQYGGVFGSDYESTLLGDDVGGELE